MEHKAVKKAKKGLFSIVFGRTALILMLVLIQLIVLVGVATILNDYAVYVYGGFTVLAAVIVIYIINERGNPAFNMTWVLLILIFPAFGCLFYIWVKSQLGTRYIGKRLCMLRLDTAKYMQQEPQVIEALRESKPANANLAHYMQYQLNFPTYRNTQVQYFACGEEKFPVLLEELKKAEKFIFLEYFIAEPGKMLDAIVEILAQKAKEGVDVRFMYDGIGCIQTLPNKYYRYLQEKGIKCACFQPFRPLMSIIQNNRDHRKITVIDGRVAYTGGMNLADEYINARVRFGYWKDAAIRLTGECVWSFTSMFLELWDYILKTESDYTFYRATSMEKHRLQEKIHADEKGFVQPYTDSPLDHEDVGENVYLNIISRAKKYLYIFTPYLIIGSEMRTALVNAAKSGVDVRLVVPGIPDKKLVYFLTQSNFPYLIKNGVKIYTYTPGFIHAKCFVSDDVQATVGTVNMDYRSLCLHFECGVWMYRTRAVLQVKEDALKTFAESHEVTLEEFQKKSFLVRTFMGALKLFAPLL